jgi:hypothetical protein
MQMASTQPATPRRQVVVATAIRVLLTIDAVALLFAGGLHVAGAQIPLGSATFVEPQIMPAAIVESLAELIFVVAACAVFTRGRWAWTSTVVALAFAIAGFLLGLLSTRNGTSPFNAVYHHVMLAFFVAGPILILLPIGREALGRTKGSESIP